MATEWISPTWRMPNDKNQSKFENYSLDFDAAGSEYIESPSSSDLDFGTNDFTISAWVKTTGTPAQHRTVVCKQNPSNSNEWTFQVNADGKVNFYGAGGSVDVISTTTVNDGNWHHILIKRTSNVFELYIDNVLADQETPASQNLTNTANLRIGHRNSSYNAFFDGSISQVAIFDYALSSTQISYLYNSGTPINPMAISGQPPVAYYPLGGSSTGSSSTLTIPNESVADATVFEFNVPSGGIDRITLDQAITLTGNKTFSAWINLTMAQDASGFMFFGEATTNYYLFIQGDYIYIRDASGFSSAQYTPGFSLNTWYHICISGDGTNLIPYVNGEPISGTYADREMQSENTIGSYSNGTFPYRGEMSNVQIWDTNLSGPEVTTLYNNGVPLYTGTQPQAANLRVWYPMNVENANWLGSDWQIDDTTSAYPQSFDFVSADGDRVVIPDVGMGTGVVNGINGAMTASIWVNTTAGLVYAYAFNRDQIGGTNRDWNLTKDNFYGSGGRMIFSVFNTSNVNLSIRLTGSTDPQGDPLITMNDGKWHHIVGVYNGTDTVELYTDGVLQGTNTSAGHGAINTTSRTVIGGYNNSSNPAVGVGSWNGDLSNAQIWNTNLSSAEVETLYNNGSPLTTAIASSNLKGWYKLNNNEIWDGTNWEVENQGYPASYESALDFVAVDNDYIDLGTDSSLDIFGGDFSVSLWFKHSNSTGAARAMMEIPGFSDKMAMTLGFTSNTGVGFAVGSTWNYNAGSGFNDGTWHHMVATRTGTTYKIYVDTVDIAFSTGTWGYQTSSIKNVIGNGGFGLTKDFNGELSNVAIFNTTLDSAAVTALYNNGTPETSISSSPVSWWKLDNLTTGIQDSAGSNNGTNNGATKVNTFVSTQIGVSSGMTESNLVDNNVSALNGTSDGMTTANLVNSDLTRSIPYSSYSMNFDVLDADYIDCGTNVIGDESNLSISVWIKTIAALSGSLSYGIIYNGDFSSSMGKISLLIDTTQKLRIHLNSGYVWRTDWTSYQDKWTHLVLSYDGSSASNSKVYVNGVVDAGDGTYTFSTGNIDGSGLKTIIGSYYGSSNTFDGKLSNAAVFGSTLTEDQVLTIYNGGVPNSISSLSPVGWWSLAGDSYYNGTDWICPDLGSGGNNGTSANMSGTELVGDAPGGSANGTSTNMDIPTNLKGNAPNSSSNAFSVNMDTADRVASVPS